MSEPTNQVHEIVTIADLVKVVNMDNYEALSKDLNIFLLNIASTKGLVDAAGGNGENLEFQSLHWCDDNLNKVTNNVELVGSEKKETLQVIITAINETSRD